MDFDNVKRMAENWSAPRFEERRTNFPHVVQQKLGEFAARDTAHSPPAYAAVERVAFEEIEQLGRVILEGYERALTATPGICEPTVVLDIKQHLQSVLMSEASRIHGVIRYVREACRPARTVNAQELPVRALQKLDGDLDLFCAQLNTSRGLPTFGWKPSSVTYTSFRVYEQGQLDTAEALQQLVERLFLEPETEIKYYYQDGTEMDGLLVEAIRRGDIVHKKSEFRFFRHPQFRHDYVKVERIEQDDSRREVAETTPEFVEVILELSGRKRSELDTIRKIQFEEQIRTDLKRQKCAFDVFLSYSDTGRDTASIIHKKVSTAGGRIFMAPKEISPGDDFAEKIREALIHSEELWLLVTPRSIKSEWVISEWGAAWALEKRIVPILYQCQRSDLPERLRKIQTVDMHLIDELVEKSFGQRS